MGGGATDSAQLIETNERLAGILAAALDCIVTVDHHGKIVEFNPAAERTFGYPAAEVLGRDMADLLIPPSLRQRHHDGMARHLATGEARVLGQRVQVRAVRRDGSEFPCELTITRLKVAGNPVFTAFLRDITDRVAAEERIQAMNTSLERQVVERTAELQSAVAALEAARDRLEKAQKAAHVGDIELDLASGATQWSREARRLHGFSAETAPARMAEALVNVHPADHVAVRGFLDAIATASENGIDYRVVAADGHVRWLNLAPAAGQRIEAETKLLLLVQDVTVRKAVERELLATIERERELGQLKADFLHMVTHEYRTPLGVIMTSAEILERYAERLGPGERAQKLKEIRGNTRRLAQMLDDVLFLGRAESGRLTLETAAVEVESWLQEITDEVVHSLGAERTIDLVVSKEARHARLDPRVLGHALSNVISNALKYSTLDRPVRIAAEVAREQLTFRVADEGIGIPVADQQKLFQTFRRASNVGTVSGTGLGLVIVKRCVELHGGTLKLESEVGRGTTVTVQIPFQNPETPSEHG